MDAIISHLEKINFVKHLHLNSVIQPFYTIWYAGMATIPLQSHIHS